MGNRIEWSSIAADGSQGRAHFGDPRREFDAARTAAAVTPAAQFQLLLVHGTDAQAFLQAQLTCDVDQVTPDRAAFGGYCTPKGRLLASMILLRTTDAYLLLLPADIAAGIAERLRKFILRAKVKIETESSWRAIGLVGPQAGPLLERAIGVVPAATLESRLQNDLSVTRLPGNVFLVCAPISRVDAVWQTLSQGAVQAGADCWSWAQVDAGIPWITTATQDQFLPQMIGLDTIHGVSFDKGCYPGQEIVARAKYLGEVKRGLRTASSAGAASAGDAVQADGQPVGTVLNAASMPGGGSTMLAVLQTQAGASNVLSLAGGERIELQPVRAD